MEINRMCMLLTEEKMSYLTTANSKNRRVGLAVSATKKVKGVCGVASGWSVKDKPLSFWVAGRD